MVNIMSTRSNRLLAFKKQSVSYRQADKMCRNLGEKVVQDCVASGFKYDGLIYIPRGGLFPANIIARILGLDGTQMYAFGLSSYDSSCDKYNNKLSTGQLLSRDIVEGKTLLLVDEVCDSGRSLKFVYDQLYALGAKVVKTAVIHFKPDLSQTDFVPDFYITTTKKWVSYPWCRYDK